MRFLVRAAVAALCVTLSACGGGGGGGDGTPAPQNSAPTFGALTFSTTEDTDLTVRIPASDADGDAFTFAQTTNPTRGSVLALDAATGNITYRPSSNATGVDTFTIRATDAGGRATTGTVSITITPVNDLPTATAAAMVTDQATSIGSRIVVNDAEGDAITFTLTRAPSNGTVSAFTADGSFTYQPTAQFAGADSFDVTVTDAQGGSTLVTVPVTVAPSALAYSGSQAQVVIGENNAGQLSKSLWDNFSRLIALYEAGARPNSYRPVSSAPRSHSTTAVLSAPVRTGECSARSTSIATAATIWFARCSAASATANDWSSIPAAPAASTRRRTSPCRLAAYCRPPSAILTATTTRISSLLPISAACRPRSWF